MLVAIGDVQQLHGIGRVVPLALQRVTDLGPNRRAIVRKRQGLDVMACAAERRGQSIGLCLLAALVEPFERYEVSVHQFAP